MIMKKPTLSIITVNYNNNDGLEKTLQSVRMQSYQDYEHIIIDANSTDGSKETIEHYAQETDNHLTYWVSEPDKGIFDGMNKGIAHAQGEYLYFLNSGDFLVDDLLKDIPFDGTQYIYGDMVLRRPKKKEDRNAPDSLNLIFFYYDSLSHQACFIHRSLFADEQYSTRYRIVSDWAHSVTHIIFKGATYRHIPRVIAECDGTGISSDYIDVQTERIQWFRDNLPPQYHALLMDLLEYYQSEFKSIIPALNKTRKFQGQVLKLVKFLLWLRSLVPHTKPKHPYSNHTLYRMPRGLKLS